MPAKKLVALQRQMALSITQGDAGLHRMKADHANRQTPKKSREALVLVIRACRSKDTAGHIAASVSCIKITSQSGGVPIELMQPKQVWHIWVYWHRGGLLRQTPAHHTHQQGIESR